MINKIYVVIIVGVLVIGGVGAGLYVYGNMQMNNGNGHEGNGNSSVVEPEWTEGKMWRLLQGDVVDLSITLSNETVDVEYVDLDNKTVNVTCKIYENGGNIYSDMEDGSKGMFTMGINPILGDKYDITVVVYRDWVKYSESYPVVYNNTVEYMEW